MMAGLGNFKGEKSLGGVVCGGCAGGLLKRKRLPTARVVREANPGGANPNVDNCVYVKMRMA
jgi:hypothetical protein